MNKLVLSVFVGAFAGALSPAAYAAVECLPENVYAAQDNAWGGITARSANDFGRGNETRRAQLLFDKTVVKFQTAEKLCAAKQAGEASLVRVVRFSTGLGYWTHPGSLQRIQEAQDE